MNNTANPTETTAVDTSEAPAVDILGAPKKRKNSVIVKEELIAQSYSGPIPPPEAIAKYANVDSSLPDRIFTMAEKEQDLRIEQERALILEKQERVALEKQQLKSSAIQNIIDSVTILAGNITSILIIMAILWVVVYCAKLGHYIGLGLSGLGGLAFIIFLIVGAVKYYRQKR